MTRGRVVLFIYITLAILLIPEAVPFMLWHSALPAWSYLLYGLIVMVNAGIYLLNRLVLIDRLFVRGRIRSYVLWNLLLLAVTACLQIFALSLSSGFLVPGGETVAEILDFGVMLSQKVFIVVLGIIMVLVALAVSLSDEWRLAAFRYREAARENERLGRDIDSLKGQVDALRSRDSVPDSISVKVDLMMTRIPLADMETVKADGDYVVIHLSDGRELMTLMTLKAMEKQLPFDRFCRTHRSWIVNVDKIRGLRGGKLLVGETSVPLSDSCKAAFFELVSHRSIVLRTE